MKFTDGKMREKKFHNGYVTGTGMYLKSGSAISLKDRLWTSFLVRYQQYIPYRKNGRMSQLDRDWAFLMMGFR